MRLRTQISKNTFVTINAIAEEKGISVEEVIRHALGLEEYIYVAISSGKKLYIQDKDSDEISELIFK